MATQPTSGGKSSFRPSQIQITQANIEAELAHKRMAAEHKERIIGIFLSANFLVFVVTFSVIISGFWYMNKTQELEKITEYWKIILPLITTYVGYAIGKNQGSGGE